MQWQTITCRCKGVNGFETPWLMKMSHSRNGAAAATCNQPCWDLLSPSSIIYAVRLIEQAWQHAEVTQKWVTVCLEHILMFLYSTCHLPCLMYGCADETDRSLFPASRNTLPSSTTKKDCRDGPQWCCVIVSGQMRHKGGLLPVLRLAHCRYRSSG